MSLELLRGAMEGIPDLERWVALVGCHALRMPPFDPKRILVVGLGSPVVFGVAAAHPGAAVVGTDEDPAVVAVGEPLAGALGLTNLRIVGADLGDAESVPGPFEWIHCPEPLRPAGDEAEAYRTLAAHLAQDGLLTARLRSRRREYWPDEFREAVCLLARSETLTDLAGWMGLGQGLALDLARGGSRLAGAARQAAAQLRQAPSPVAAQALLPAGHAHTLDSARALLAQAGLCLHGLLNTEAWDPEGGLPDPELRDLLGDLTADERLEVADILRAPDYLLVCGHPRNAREPEGPHGP